MANRLTDSEIWGQTWFRKSPLKIKLLWKFLCEQCNHAGFWEPDPEAIVFYIGESVNQEEAFQYLNQDKTRVIIRNKKWFLPQFIPFQYKCSIEELNPKNRVHSSVIDILKKEGVIKPHRSPLKGVKDKDKDKDKDSNTDKKNKDIDFITALKENPAYKHINIENELHKMDAWLLTRKGKQKTRRFVVNWLNRIDKPVGVAAQARVPTSDPDCDICKGTGKIPDGQLQGATCNCVKIRYKK